MDLEAMVGDGVVRCCDSWMDFHKALAKIGLFGCKGREDDSNNAEAVLETRLEKLLVRGASKLKKLLAPLKSSLSSYFEAVRDQSIKLIMLYFRFRFP